MLSWDRVFLMRRAVKRAAPLAYQHSLIILPMTRKAWNNSKKKVYKELGCYDKVFVQKTRKMKVSALTFSCDCICKTTKIKSRFY